MFIAGSGQADHRFLTVDVHVARVADLKVRLPLRVLEVTFVKAQPVGRIPSRSDVGDLDVPMKKTVFPKFLS